MNIEHLYHYTSIETLALILEYKTIRFSGLNKVDDLEEVKTGDYGDLGRFCFVSCWTDLSEESIPLWKMYTPDMRGVRIKLPVYPFKTHTILKNQFHCGEDFESYIDFKHHYEKYSYVLNPPFKDILIKVEYTNDLDLVFPKVYCEETVGSEIKKNLQIAPLGRYKKSIWQFQNEWRYRLFICPWTLAEAEYSTVEKHIEFFDRFKTHYLPFDTYDLALDDNKIKDMEILIGPKATKAEEIIVQSLIKHYNPTAKIIKSILSIR